MTETTLTIEERIANIEETQAQILEILTELLEKVNNISTPGADYGFDDE